ncbi:MAG: HAMP domain-containing sensor histidine kinase [Snowella sp.]|nr:HAMP domain-containing sensor histidine kinase [Snowella sp.]
MVITPNRFLTFPPISQMLLGQRLIHLIGHHTESQQILPAMAEMIGLSLDVDICILVVGALGQSSLRGVSWTPSKKNLLGKSSPVLKHSWLKAVQAQEYPLLLTSNTNSLQAFQITKDLVMRSGLGLRIVFQNKVNGMVIVGSSQDEKDYSLQEAQLVEIADSLAIANHFFQTLPLNTSETNKVNNLNRAVPTDESPILKAWYEATRQKLEQQRSSHDQLIHNIVTIMSDQTRNPLATIRMGIEMLRRNPPSPEKLQQRLDILEQEWRKLNEINEKILQLKTSKFNKTTLQVQKINLTDFIQRLVANYEIKWAEYSKKIVVKTDLPKKALFFDADINYLQQICDELFTNAQKFALKNTDITLKIRESQEKGRPAIVLQLSNLTPSIDSKNLAYFFDPFYREQWVIDNAIAGIGLGLCIIKELVEQLDGRIAVTCDPTEDVDYCLMTFTLTFPLGLMATSISHAD